MLRKVLIILCTNFLISCATRVIEPVGTLGPKKLPVFVVKDNDFISGSRMLVVLNDKGDVTAYSGGTVQGTGSIAAQVADTAISATAMIVGAKAIEHGLENSKINIKGIPRSVDINTDNSVVIK